MKKFYLKVMIESCLIENQILSQFSENFRYFYFFPVVFSKYFPKIRILFNSRSDPCPRLFSEGKRSKYAGGYFPFFTPLLSKRGSIPFDWMCALLDVV
jgi:hypothetical protein